MTQAGLIFPFIAWVRPWVGADQQDPDFHEPVLHTGADADGPGISARQHGTPYPIACQIEPDGQEATSLQANGDAAITRVSLLFACPGHGGLVPRRRDLLVSLNVSRGQVFRDFGAAGGLAAVEIRALSAARFRGRTTQSLWRVTFEGRGHAVRRVA